jgi:hypothetical protein
MGYDCGSTAVGSTLAELLASVQVHVIEFHGFTQKEAEAQQFEDELKGALKQSARPGNIRTPREMDEEGRDVIPH